MKAAHAKLDAYAHNPYPTRPRVESPLSGACATCGDVSMANLNRLLTEVRRDFGGKEIWLTEYGYQTDPPDPWLGVPPATQALYESEAALRAYQLPHVTLLIHFLLRDEPDVGRFQSGLFTSGGSQKPDYDAFRLPLAQVTRSGSRVVLWGQVRPGTGARRYRLQVRSPGGAWHWLDSLRRTTTAGFISRTVTARQGSTIRIWSPDANAYGWPLLVR
jgi:hypothetical protein